MLPAEEPAHGWSFPYGTFVNSRTAASIVRVNASAVRVDEARINNALRFLYGLPVELDAAAKGLGRGSGLYAWWADPSVFPDLPGPSHTVDPTLRMLYLGRATGLRGRILRSHLRRSDSSTLRRTLVGLLPSEGFRTTWTDQVVLVAEDELRLTAWMHAHLRLTWAEDPDPETIAPELVRRLRPPLNVHGLNPQHVHPAVVAAKNAYNASAEPPAGTDPRTD